jgi:hypothetical protein
MVVKNGFTYVGEAILLIAKRVSFSYRIVNALVIIFR